jgi:hypothetical protein
MRRRRGSLTTDPPGNGCQPLPGLFRPRMPRHRPWVPSIHPSKNIFGPVRRTAGPAWRVVRLPGRAFGPERPVNRQPRPASSPAGRTVRLPRRVFDPERRINRQPWPASGPAGRIVRQPRRVFRLERRIHILSRRNDLSRGPFLRRLPTAFPGQRPGLPQPRAPPWVPTTKDTIPSPNGAR